MKKLRALALSIVLALGVSVGVRAAGEYDNQGVSSKGLVVTTAGEASIWTDRAEYKVGEPVKIGFRSSVDGYATIYDISPTGESQPLWPSGGGSSLIRAGKAYSLPERGQTIAAAEPLGQESLVLVVSPNKPTFNLNLSFNFDSSFDTSGQAQRGLVVTDNGRQLPSNSFSAQCSFRVVALNSRPALRISGPAGARLFVDGNDYGTVGSSPFTFEPGYHQLVALLAGMKVEVKDLNMKFNTTYDWRLNFKQSR